jgi:hypothetical protein
MVNDIDGLRGIIEERRNQKMKKPTCHGVNAETRWAFEKLKGDLKLQRERVRP